MDIFPIEIMRNILIFINDDISFNNSRLTCKKWKFILNNVIKFDEGKISEIIYFYDTKIESFYPNKFLKKRLIFKNYGDSYYEEYNTDGILKNKVSYKFPYKLKYTQNFSSNIINKTCDIRNNEIKTEYLPINLCLIS